MPGPQRPGPADAGPGLSTLPLSSSIVVSISPSPEHLERSERWHGLRPGDPVAIRGLKMRSSAWEFRAHVRNLRSGAESIEVVGGRPGDRKIRSFRPEQVFPVSSRRSGKGGGAELPSLRDAPQLPFG